MGSLPIQSARASWIHFTRDPSNKCFNYSKLLTNHLLRFYIAIEEQLFVLKISLFSAIWNLGTITALPFSNWKTPAVSDQAWYWHNTFACPYLAMFLTHLLLQSAVVGDYPGRDTQLPVAEGTHTLADLAPELGPSHNVFEYSTCKSSTCTWLTPHTLAQVAGLWMWLDLFFKYNQQV